MRKVIVYRTVLWVFTLGLAGAIFWLSHQTAEQSGALSEEVTQGFFGTLFSFLKLTEGQQAVVHALVRSAAHVVLFALLGTSVALLFRSYAVRRWQGITVLVCGAYALVDECHQQWFSAGRAFELADLVKDIVGVLLGIGAVLLVCFWRAKLRKKGT